MAKIEFFEVRVCITGIKKRCRKAEFKSFKLNNVSLDTKTNETEMLKIKEEARTILDREMKSLTTVPFLSFQYAHEHEASSDMIVSYPFDDKNFKVAL